ncbi:hypothetical protein [Sphingomonas sp. LH128]|uniref:hypothetical protein n=1 Tax=Sphingomonas sp. LH128 TaxID=473781 RepID=UPI00155EAE72|nr:hypothetical protein [Sphingomonas sp. LH128]
MGDFHITVAQAAADTSSVWKDYGVPFATAILGALLAYFPSRLLAGRASKELIVRDEKARHEAEVVAARKVFIKLTVLVNAILDYHNQIEAMVLKAEQDGNGQMTIAQRLSAFVGVEREPSVSFTADELEVFIAAKRVDYVDNLVLLSRRHGAMLSNLAAFGRMKTDLHYELAKYGHTMRDDDLVSTTAGRMPAPLANYFRTQSDELNLYAMAMRQMITVFADFARDVAKDYGPITRDYLGDDAMLDLSEEPAAPTQDQ